MRCAVSFLSVLVLVIGVGVAAFLIIWKTTPRRTENSTCHNVTEFECLEENLCIPKERRCNGVSDCPWGSDEVRMACEDLTTTIDILMRHFNCGKKDVNTSFNEDLQLPEGCIKLHKGIFCGDRNMTPIPWDQLHMQATQLTFANILHVETLSEQLVPPEDNTINKVFIDNNTIVTLENGSICHWEHTCTMTLMNNSIRHIKTGAFCRLPELEWLDLSMNKFNLIGFSFPDLPKLKDLFLNNNQIETITQDVFSALKELLTLNLDHNKIQVVDEKAFRHNTKLHELHLAHNRIKKIYPLGFISQSKLRTLTIGYNPLESLPAKALYSLQSLESLHLHEIDAAAFDIAAFNNLTLLDYIYFKKFSYCRYVPKVSRCYPFADGVSSRINLLGGETLRWIVWIVAILTLIGNSMVLICRCYLSSRPRVLDIFINNLAGADILMGVYLTILAIKDIEYRDIYHVHAYAWSTSFLCSGIGILAMISSEVSLLMLTIVSVERYLAISGPPFNYQNLTRNLGRLSVAIIWLFVTVLAVAPAIQYRGKFSFYGSTGLCFPVHLDDPFTIGWQYTFFLFVGLNSICLIIMAVSYIQMFYVIRKTRKEVPIVVKNVEMKMAIRFFLMVFTGCICWLPIILLKIFSLTGNQIPKEFITWIVVFVLPINSAINPYLYTLSMGDIRMNLLGRLIQTSSTRRSRNINLPLRRQGENNTEDSHANSWDTTTNTTNVTNNSRDIKHPSHRNRLSYQDSNASSNISYGHH